MACRRIPLVLSTLALVAGGPAPRALADAIPGSIAPGPSVELVDFVQIPPSSATRPLARLNLLGHAGDGSGRVFVNDMRGIVYVIEDGIPAPFLDLNTATQGALVSAGLQQGVSTFAFHPDYARAGAVGFGRFYTVTTQTPASGASDFDHPSGAIVSHSVLTEWLVDPSDPNRIDPGSAREILRVGLASGDHLMSQIGFDPNASPGDPDYGNLYVAIGDGGGYVTSRGDPVDPFGTAQDLTNPFGSILRIDPLGTGSGSYGVPADNPYTDASDGSLPEIWANGFRNPHRFSWDTGGEGVMLISDIGQENVEEVDLGLAGGNYGWSEREGTFVLDPLDPSAVIPLPIDDAMFGFSYPIAQYDHDEGFAIVGGFVYRGSLIPHLRGLYLFGDNNGRLFSLDIDALLAGDAVAIEEVFLLFEGEQQTLLEILGETRRADLRFGIDEDGEIYLLTKRDGMVRRLVPEPGAGDLLAFGCVALAVRSRRRSGIYPSRRGSARGEVGARSL